MLEPYIGFAQSLAGPVAIIVGLFYVTIGPHHYPVGGNQCLALPDAEALARHERNGGKQDVRIHASEDASHEVPYATDGPAYWPPMGRWYAIRDGKLVTG